MNNQTFQLPFTVGESISNRVITDTFKCKSIGGIRYSAVTNIYKKHAANNYRGQVKLVIEPHQEIQSDKNGTDRLVWLFPLRLLQEVNG